MGLGPSTKMTTLHHYDCPITKGLLKEKDLDFCGVIVNGVSESYDDKVFTAKRSADIANAMRVDGAIVEIDGWGNHHIDFVSVIEELGKKGIPSVGVSYFGLQGRLVCTNQYVETLVDFNKNTSGYESCIVGDNNINEYDVYKAIGLLKHKLKNKINGSNSIESKDRIVANLTRCKYPISNVIFGDKTEIEGSNLFIGNDIKKFEDSTYDRIEKIKVNVIKPDDNHHFFINSNLDFIPIACKNFEELGQGNTIILDGIKVMLTGVEDVSGFQPSNIGSSEGYLDEVVKFNEAGTPKDRDILLHIDVLFKEGEGRTSEGLSEAHYIMDSIVDKIRKKMKSIEVKKLDKEEFYDRIKIGKPKVILVKITSGLGNMYDTSVFPFEPCGYIGSTMLRKVNNFPVVISPCQCLDGVIHSLL